MSRGALFEVILAPVHTVYHIPPRLVLTLMSESWKAPLVSSCVAKAIPCKSKGQEGGEPRRRCRRGRLLLHWFFSLSILQKQMQAEKKLGSEFAITESNTSLPIRPSKKRKTTCQNILAAGREKKPFQYREYVFLLWLVLTRCSLHESILFN